MSRAGLLAKAMARARSRSAPALRALIWALLRVLPSRPHAVVHGWPDNEANAIEVIRGLRRRYPGRIYWLLEDVAFAGPSFAAEELNDPERIVRVKKASLHSLRVSVTAEVIFFTHGLYTAVDPPANRLVVNLWHGDGPKASRDTDLVRSTVVVSGSRLWGDYKAKAFHVPRAGVAVVGNPRVDEFREDLPAASLRQLGLRPEARRVLWMPTYREARGPGARSWTDGQALTENEEFEHLARVMAHAAQRLSLELLIKPHPLDVDTYAAIGVRVIRGEQLDDAGVSLYQLIGSCAALISDISSAWVDYLMLDRPIGFYIPDLEAVKRRHGLNVPDLEALLPGVRIESAADACDFLERVARNAPELRPSAYPGLVRIGVPPVGHVTDRLLDWLCDFQRARGRGELFRASSGPPSPR